MADQRERLDPAKEAGLLWKECAIGNRGSHRTLVADLMRRAKLEALEDAAERLPSVLGQGYANRAARKELRRMKKELEGKNG